MPLATTIILLITLSCSLVCVAQEAILHDSEQHWAKRIADSFLARHPDCGTYDSASSNQQWNYEQGLMLVALLRMWQHTGDGKYFGFVRTNLDHFIAGDGTIRTYSASDYNLDNIGPGRAVLAVYDTTHEERYRLAAEHLRQQLQTQPRTKDGGYWHKNIYPNQIWLDGLFMAQPFSAAYCRRFHDTGGFSDIAGQFLRIYKHTLDEKTGLLYHGWDESKREKWADPVTGCSSQFWARAMGWYLMGLVDVLEILPDNQPAKERIAGDFRRLAGVLLKFRDNKVNLWYQVVDQGTREGNYLETSASAMFIYAFAKGARLGYLPPRFYHAAWESFRELAGHAITTNSDGTLDIHGTCQSVGLGGSPYRDGSYEYYVSQPQRTNDLRGIGSVLLAAIELEEGNAVQSGTIGGNKGDQ